ncbi:MAG: hypothetical protein IKQ37_09520 [Bacteroidaceae bacterium]|nr:hypothetical protein [Bacteroidaceae bacterium]
MNGYTLTKVFEINKTLVVADSVEDAIRVYKLRSPEDEVRNVCQISGSDVASDYSAIIAEPPDCNFKKWELTHITFTGVDEWTDINELVDIQRRYPKVEFGVLVSRKWQENNDRYMSPEQVKKLQGHGLRLSAHFCGSLAREVFDMGGFSEIHGAYDGMFDRVQLNVATYTDVAPTCIMPGPLKEVIIQQGSNLSIFEQCHIASGDHVSVLLDKSGGQGIDSPIEVPLYTQKVHVGFAGGIGPDNVIDKLKQITSSPNIGKFWIDMESSVRTYDTFDVGKVEEVCKKVYEDFLNK